MECDYLIVAAHPDDAEIGMGGTIAAMVASKRSVVIVDLTNGEPTPFGSPAQRQKEWEAASSLLGVTQRVNLGLTNRELKDDLQSRKALASVIRQYRPKLLFAPYYEDAHPDHLAASALVIAARFYAKFTKSDLAFEPHYPGKVIHYFSTHMQVKFSPSFIFDISQHLETKLAALKCYKSQFIDNNKNSSIFDAVKLTNSYWGQQSGCQYGEPFVCREQIKLSSFEALSSI